MRTGEGEVTGAATWGEGRAFLVGVKKLFMQGTQTGPQPSVLLRGRSPVSILPWGAEALAGRVSLSHGWRSRGRWRETLSSADTHREGPQTPFSQFWFLTVRH